MGKSTAVLAIAIVLLVIAVAAIVASFVLLAQQLRDKKHRVHRPNSRSPATTTTATLAQLQDGGGNSSAGCAVAPCATQTPVGVGLPGPPLAPPPGGAPVAPVCDDVTDVPPYELTATWYGVASSLNPIPAWLFKSNFEVMQRYFAKKPQVLRFSGFLIHLDTPAPSGPYSNDIGLMAECIAGLPGDVLRVGLEVDPSEDSTWAISPATITVPTTVPGFPDVPYALPPKLQYYLPGTGPVPAPGPAPAPPPPTNPNFVFYGGPGAYELQQELTSNPQVTDASNVNPQTGFPYQYKAAECWNGFHACEYKPTKSVCNGVAAPCDNETPPSCTPDGCPGNFGRVAWYIAAVNDIIRAIGAAQSADARARGVAPPPPPPTITMVMWETEFSGSVGIACGIFSFGFGLQQFGSYDDCFPAADTMPPLANGQPRTDTRFRVYINGGTALGPASVVPNKDACWDWARVPVPAFPGKVYGDFLGFKGSGEYYWLDGANQSDAGNVGGGGVVGAGLAPSLLAEGFVGCPQSGAGKQYANDKCGCRSTVYNAYGKQDNGGVGLLKALTPLYQSVACAIPQTAPTLSIEQLGSDTNPQNVALCINSHNYYTYHGTGLDAGPDPSCWACYDDAKALNRCGVFNGFGGWTEQCMKQFIEAFVKQYQPGSSLLATCSGADAAANAAAGPQEIVLYDMGFLPPSWLAPEDQASNYVQPSVTDAGAPPVLCNGRQISPPNGLSPPGTPSCVPVNCYEVGGEAFCASTCPSILPGPPAPPPYVPVPATGKPCKTDQDCWKFDKASYCNNYKSTGPYFCH